MDASQIEAADMDDRDRALVRSLQRGLRLLEAVATMGRADAKELSRSTGLALPTTYHLLRTLVHERYLQRADDGSYVVGSRAAEIGPPFGSVTSVTHTAVDDAHGPVTGVVAGRDDAPTPGDSSLDCVAIPVQIGHPDEPVGALGLALPASNHQGNDDVLATVGPAVAAAFAAQPSSEMPDLVCDRRLRSTGGSGRTERPEESTR